MSLEVVLPRHRRWVLGVCIAAWIGAFAATHVPAPRVPYIRGSDKSLHVIGYTGLTSFVWASLVAYGRPRRRRVPQAALMLAVYGMFDEITQPLVRRTVDPMDWAMDCVGIVLAIAGWELAGAIARRGRET